MAAVRRGGVVAGSAGAAGGVASVLSEPLVRRGRPRSPPGQTQSRRGLPRVRHQSRSRSQRG
eukprot:7615121-Pyramimonas_sp.AAC.1